MNHERPQADLAQWPHIGDRRARKHQSSRSPSSLGPASGTGLPRPWPEAGLVEENLSETALCELRRVRRLMSLGVNLHGVEIIMRMRRQRIRRRIQELEAELARLQSGLRR